MSHSGAFHIERLVVVGPDVPPAVLDFTDGLNVVTGASDTGKSWVVECIEFMLGGKDLPRAIPEASKYSAAELQIVIHATSERVRLGRALRGGLVRWVRMAGTEDVESIELSPTHDSDSLDNLSARLLELCGLRGQRVKLNKQGEHRPLSFRDFAYLTIVDEERIISERPPHLSGTYSQRTAETDVLRLVATGVEATFPSEVVTKKKAEGARAKVELLTSLIADAESQLSDEDRDPEHVAGELRRVEAARESQLAGLATTQAGVTDTEQQIEHALHEVRELDARLETRDALLQRFRLLDQHYASDTERLDAIREAGTLLDSLTPIACPVCGAAPEAHDRSRSDAQFKTDLVRTAAIEELARIRRLRVDLAAVNAELSTELDELRTKRAEVADRAKAIEERLRFELRPALAAVAEIVRAQDGLRDRLLRAAAMHANKSRLAQHLGALDGVVKTAKAAEAVRATVLRSAEMEGLARAVEFLLQEWDYPEVDRVLFSESDQDLVIRSVARASHGKGVRAVTCAAFIAGLMRHCIASQLSHPGIVVLDSPLLVYRDPDQAGDARALREHGVKDAFYRSLASGAAHGQVIVFENEEPPADVRAAVTYHHFTKSSTGRYGFIPRS